MSRHSIYPANTASASEEQWPSELSYLWDRSLSAEELGGLIATRGFYYQYLYSLRLMADIVLKRNYSAYICEVPEDFMAWSSGTDGSITRIALVQLKIDGSACYLRSNTKVQKVFHNFKRAAIDVLERTPALALLEFRLVCNAHPGCGTGCGAATRQKLRWFEEEIKASFPGVALAVEFDHFLPIPATRDEFLQELLFLEGLEPGLLRFLQSSDSVPTLVRNLMVMILPYHSAQSGSSLREHARADDHDHWARLQSTRRDVVSDLRQALNQAAERLRAVRSCDVLEQRHQNAKTRAEREIGAARTTGPARNITPTLAFSDRTEALAALEAVYLIQHESVGCLFQPGGFNIYHDAEEFRFVPQASNEDRPLWTLLRQLDCTHATRIQLILSFVRKLASWSSSGVRLSAFRAHDARYRDLYLAELDASGSPVFVLADLGALSVYNASSSLLEPQWTRGSLLAAAVRYLYYGVVSKGGAKRTAIFGHAWNDNIVFDLAEWLDRSGLVCVNRLAADLEELFKDECQRWPIFFEAVREEFVRDITDAGFETVSEAISSLHPTRLLADRSAVLADVFYAFSDDLQAQIGLLKTSPWSFTLYRYVPYLGRRWAGRRDRDVGTSVDLDIGWPRRRVDGVFVGVGKPSDVPDLIRNVFGVSPPQYVTWLNSVIQAARDRPRKMLLPEVLRLEEDLLKQRRDRLDRLARVSIDFEVDPDPVDQPQTTAQVRLRLADASNLLEQLRGLGYGFVDDKSSLTVRAVDSFGRRLVGPLEAPLGEPPDEIACVVPDRLDDGFGPDGTLQIADIGTEAVIAPEESLLRDLRFSLTRHDADTPALRAWRVFEPLFGKRALGPRSTENLWSGKTRVAHPAAIEDADNQTAAGIIGRLTSSEQESSVHLLTGAPGTGKTRLAAQVAMGYLERLRDRAYPPPRVLVIAASHFGVDNFLRTFLDQKPQGVHIYRHLPSGADALKNRGIIDAEIVDRLSDDLNDHLKPGLPAPRPRGINGPTLTEYAAHLRATLAVTEVRRALGTTMPGGGIPATIIPSHERWRSVMDCGRAWRAPGEIETKIVLLTNRLADLEGFSDAGPAGTGNEYYSSEGHYTYFAVDMIATTPDAFTRLPDMVYDLVLFEEASQLSALKLLKVLAKVMRPLGGGERVAVLLSGDPQQLPPFFENHNFDPAATEVTGTDVPSNPPIPSRPVAWTAAFRKNETPFERLCTGGDKTVLTVQHRMHPSIATLVNSLFYGNQEWRTTRRDTPGGVEWMNTNAMSPHVRRQPGDTSLYNRAEIGVVERLVRFCVEPGQTVLVVSPYRAQVAELLATLDRQIHVRTIDGCQGIEADVVIVSFVTFDFSETRDFVVDPRRMNVALSRARDRLFLVGDLGLLRNNVAHLKPGDGFDHLVGLAALFNPGGYFAENVKNALDETLR